MTDRALQKIDQKVRRAAGIIQSILGRRLAVNDIDEAITDLVMLVDLEARTASAPIVRWHRDLGIAPDNVLTCQIERVIHRTSYSLFLSDDNFDSISLIQQWVL